MRRYNNSLTSTTMLQDDTEIGTEGAKGRLKVSSSTKTKGLYMRACIVIVSNDRICLLKMKKRKICIQM